MAAPVSSGRARPSSRSGWIGGIVVLAVAIAWPILFQNEFLVSVGTQILITAVGATSLHLIIRTGHISLAHAGFAGIGAYTTVLTLQLGVPFPLNLLLGALLAGAVALVIGVIILRLSGKYFVLVTFLFGEIIRMTIIEWSSVTGGSSGIFGVPNPIAAVDTPVRLFYLVLLVSALSLACMIRILRSDIGRAIDSIRESEKVAECSGIPVLRFKVLIFVIGCGFAGIQGGLYAYFLKYVDPTGFSWVQSMDLLMMNVIGGMQSVVGALLGTLFLVALPELLRDYVLMQQVLFGIILIVVVAIVPGGLIEISARVRALWERRRPAGEAVS